MCDRIVILIDMDCFYCQVETRLDPSLKGKPLAVVQYNKWKGGGIIAVNYEARKFGVTRHLRGDEAKQKCQDIVLIHVPAVREKADLTKYRDAGREVVNVLCQFSDCVERASVDEAYIDITNTIEQRLKDGTEVTPAQLPHTFVVGLSDADNNEEVSALGQYMLKCDAERRSVYDIVRCCPRSVSSTGVAAEETEENRSQSIGSWLAEIEEMQDSVQLRLAIGAALVEEMRAAVFSQTGFECSAGIAHNKILSKLACGLHKPNRQTVLPQSGVNILYQTLPIKKIRSLGGKFGDVVVDQLGCTVMADLAKFSEKQLQQKFDEKTGTWLYNIARGIDNERVTQRLVSKSIGCCKKFPGKQALGIKKDIEKWLHELASEVSDRLFKDLQENKRRASLLTVSYSQDIDGRSVSSSRSGVLASYEPQKIVDEALELLKKSNTTPGTLNWNPPLKYLGISVGKFSSLVQAPKIDTFFKNVMKNDDNRPVLKCNILSDAKNKAFGICEKITNQDRNVIADNLDKNVERDITASEISRSSQFSENKQCNVDMNACLQSVINYKKKQTDISSGSVTVQPKHSSSTVSKSKRKILAKVSSKSKSKSFFLNHLRTKHLQSPDMRRDNSSFSEPRVDSYSSAKSSNIHHLHTSCHEEVVSAANGGKIVSVQGPVVSAANGDKIVSVQGPSSSTEFETDQCINVTEIFPNLSQADSDVVELLPTQMRNQIKARKLAKKAGTELTTSEFSPVKPCRESLTPTSSDSSLPENEENMNNLNVLVDVHHNLSPEKSCLSSSVVSTKRTENNSSGTNSCLVSSLQGDETVGFSKHCETKIFPDSEIPLKNVNYKSDSHGKTHCSNTVNGNSDNCLDNENHLEGTDASLGMCVENCVVSGKFLCSSSTEHISNCDDTRGASSSNTAKELCCECKKMVPLKEFPEHLDFHVAEKLQKEFNSEQIQRTVVCRSPQKQISGSKKRGRPVKKQGTLVSVDKKMRSITTYFAPR